jgi:hypothetical protein
MTTFDPASLFDTTTTEVNDTKILPIPEGEYLAVIEKAEVSTWQSRDGTKSGLRLDVHYLIDDEGAKAATGRDKLTVRQGIMLDLNEAGNGLDMGKGKNVGLGRLREATDLNIPGQPFAMAMFPGRLVKIKVSQRPGDDAETVYNDVKGVTKPH